MMNVNMFNIPIDIVPEDSGNYTCEVRGPSSVVITTVTHYVYVKGKIHYTMIMCTYIMIIYNV